MKPLPKAVPHIHYIGYIYRGKKIHRNNPIGCSYCLPNMSRLVEAFVLYGHGLIGWLPVIG